MGGAAPTGLEHDWGDGTLHLVGHGWGAACALLPLEGETSGPLPLLKMSAALTLD